jgi:hypothetical protein
VFSRKKKVLERPKFDIAHDTWPRHEFEKLKKCASEQFLFEFKLLEAVRSSHLTPKYKDQQSFQSFEFRGVSRYPHLIVDLSFQDYDSRTICTNSHSTIPPKINAEEYVGAMLLNGSGFTEYDDERLFKHNFNFRRKVNQGYLPSVRISVFEKYRFSEVELFRAAQNAKLNKGLLTVRIGFHKKFRLNFSWEEFKKYDQAEIAIPITELLFWERVPFRDEHYSFYKNEFSASEGDLASIEAYHLKIEKEYEST